MRTEDGYIVNKCLEGDPASFGLLVDKYKGGIYALAYSKLGNLHDAEDVTQEVFIKAYQKLRSLRRWDNFLAWLHAITLNLCKDWIRARSRRPDREFIADQDPRALRGFSIDSYRENPLSEVLHEALDSLSESYRQVLTLYYLGGMNSREIAEFLGMSPSAVRQRLSRARSQLKEGIVAMMNQAFEGQRLQAGFTFRIVETVKRAKIQPMPRATGLPWGLSFAAGIILTIMSLGPHLSMLNPMAPPMGSPLPAEAKVMKAGEIPVDILKTSQIPVISSKHRNSDGKAPEFPSSQDAFLLAPHGEGDTWAEKADMLTGRYGLSTSVVDGRIYAIGGAIWGPLPNGGQGPIPLPPVEEYDPMSDIWTKKADMPTPRSHLSTSVVDGKIYAIGGLNIVLDVALATVEEYDPKTNTWTKKADMPTPRGGLSTSMVNGRIYAIGGWSVHKNVFTRLSAVEEYDPETDTWAKKGDMPTPRGGLSTSVVNGKIYVIGGELSIVEEYDPVSDTWMNRKDMPTARTACTCVVNSKIYAIGGEDTARSYLPTVEIYDPVTDIWTKKEDMPTARAAHSVSVVNGKIYVFGGLEVWEQPVVPLATVDEYTAEGWRFAVPPRTKLPTTWSEEKRRGDRETR